MILIFFVNPLVPTPPPLSSPPSDLPCTYFYRIYIFSYVSFFFFSLSLFDMFSNLDPKRFPLVRPRTKSLFSAGIYVYFVVHPLSSIHLLYKKSNNNNYYYTTATFATVYVLNLICMRIGYITPWRAQYLIHNV